MKQNKNNKRQSGSPQAHSIRLEFKHPAAAAVAVAGSFNDWRPEATPMIFLGDGRWVKELVLAPGVYEYRLVVDGQWMPDPQASETAANPFGEPNSILKVNGSAG